MWTAKVPAVAGWYWMRYKVGRHFRTCPGEVIHNQVGTVVHSARNDMWIEGPLHGGPGLKCDGVLDTSVQFGPRIPEP